MDILIMLNLPVIGYGRPFNLFVSSLISFSNVLWLSVYRFYTSLVKCSPKYFIHFDITVNRLVLLTSFWIMYC